MREQREDAPLPDLLPAPAHHRPGGGFRNPWTTGENHGFGRFLKWVLVDRLTTRRPPPPPASAFPRMAPAYPSPRAPRDQLALTWVGHSTFLLQLGGWNILTDPVWSARASPVQFVGPRRHTAPGVALDALPPIDLVLLSHDHYDHLDSGTVRRLAAEHPQAKWVAPLGVGDWLRARGARAVAESDWWGELPLQPASDLPMSPLRLTSVPAQHFSGRTLGSRNGTLWCGWALRTPEHAVLFAGDTGRHAQWQSIGRKLGPFDLVLMPIGAYEPRWFMKAVHVNADEAVECFAEVADASDRSAGRPAPVMAAMHWGTFRLTDEPMDEPPRRARDAWTRAGLPDDNLWVLAHGETRTLGGARK